MKKIISILLTFILLMMCVVIPASATEITSSTTGFTNIAFSNGYIGFCIDQKKSGSVAGDKFTPAENTSVANNNIDNSDISQQLKIMFTQGFKTLFTPDGNGSYHITDETAASILEFAIYHFTGEQSYVWGDIKNLVNMVKAYTGPGIPDDGYSLTLDNGDTVTFSFMVMEPQKENQQAFFAYKLNVSQETPHEHSYSTDWKSDDTNHWHECECEDKTDIGTHSGNTADCVASSVCGTCGKELAGVDKDNHTGETIIKNAKPATEFEAGYTGDIYCKGCGELLTKGEIIPATHEHSYGTDWESDDTNHWHECECEDKTDIGTHDGNTADCVTSSVCGTCGKELAGVDKDNHTGETIIKNAKPATEFEAGYTGDIHCKGCGELLTKGEIIPATHEHSYGTDWESDDTNHWHECECEDKTDIGTHDGNTADCVTSSICGTCGKELAGVDKDNHTGETIIKNAKPATEFEAGYTGDIYCKDCDELLTKGEIIPATHEHSYGTDWESDDTNHWHECECEDKTDIGTHDGNTADCVTSSICGTCGKELAGVDKDNHTGETITKNEKPATEFEDGYTGDIHCKGCGELLTKGEIIPATHEHSYGTDWESDGTNHWHECECEAKADLGEHTYTDNACTVCGKELSADDDSDGDSNGDNNGDTDGGDDSDDGIFDMILGTLGDLDINIPDEIIEALSGLDTDAALDKITEYLSGLDMNVDFEAIINDLRDLISGSDKPESESKPENGKDTDDETADGTTDGDSNEDVGNTNSDIPDTGIGAGSKVALVIMLASVVAFALALISKKKKYVSQ